MNEQMSYVKRRGVVVPVEGGQGRGGLGGWRLGQRCLTETHSTGHSIVIINMWVTRLVLHIHVYTYLGR
jgi:hypothetical protein